ncbi:pyrroline-5-carboxylate reductase [Labrys okinawensis]|uniref:pyrroline-5-carboxylate reductase n=1 Tax=Labrys okinawensis TaxID=346911 RepID=UPI0039BD42B1
MKLGFIGTGALTSAVVSGLKSHTDNSVPVLLSPRNQEIADDLASRYADVRVATDNQAVLDACDTIMVAVRPQVAREILSALRFRPDHHVVSLIATLSREDIAGLASPAARVTKALPMPMIARRQGATLIYPSDPDMADFFGRLGKVIATDDADEFNALSVVTATFAAYFKYLDTVYGWLKDHGVADAKANDYIATIYKALAHAPDATSDPGFMHLAEEYATRGGINEQVLRELTARGMFDAFAESLGSVHLRILASQS